MRINLGTVSRDRVERIRAALKALGNKGRITLDPHDGPRLFDLKLERGVRVSFDAPYTVDYRFDGYDCHLTFSDRLKVRWMFAGVSVSEAVINSQEILIQAGLFQAKVDIQ